MIPLPPRPLGVEAVDRHPLDVVVFRHHDEDLLLGDEVLVGDRPLILDDRGSAVVGVLVFDLAELVFDDGEQFGLALEDRSQALDFDLHVLVLGFDLGGLHRGETAELHPDDVGGLLLGEVVGLPQRRFLSRPTGLRCSGSVRRRPPRVFDGRHPALEDVRSVFGFLEVVLAAPPDDLASVGDVLR